MTIRTISLAAAALASALTISAPAFAQGDDNVSIEVNLTDLDLNSAQGRTALEARVDRAALKVCRKIHNDRATESSRKVSRCRDQVSRNALAKVPNNAAFAAATR